VVDARGAQRFVLAIGLVWAVDLLIVKRNKSRGTVEEKGDKMVILFGLFSSGGHQTT